MKKIANLSGLYILLLFIITIPAFLAMLNNQYFSMHDDQHIARFYLLDQAIKQGYLYPRWVSILGFGYGYPLFNFYPPLIYYLAETFHLFGFSLIWSLKLMIISGFFLSSLGMYLFVKKIIGKSLAFLSAVLYTYFFYHAVLVYVRGALAESFALAVIPFIFLALDNLAKTSVFKNSLFFGITFALLILTHPLIAFPFIFYLGFFFIFYLLMNKQKIKFIKYFVLGLIVGLSLSAFFWLPSMIERKYTLVDNILTKDLANYKIHYIYPQQFLYSSWGYGGSIVGPYDGMTFQLGKVHILLSLLAFILSFIYLLKKRKLDKNLKYFYFFVLLLLFSLLMSTSCSSFVWDNLRYLWYLQFPWRFLTFTALFISICASYFIFLLFSLLKQYFQPPRLNRIITSLYSLFIIILSLMIIFKYQQYFKPQKLIKTSDQELTTFEEIAWSVSKSSFEFVPKGVKTKKTDLNTKTLSIDKNNLPKKLYEIISGAGGIKMLKNKFAEKIFQVDVLSPIKFRLNTYNFPGWTVYLDNKKLKIDDNNDYKLITVFIPKGHYQLKFIFQNTPIRQIAKTITILSLVIVIIFLFQNRIKRYFHFSKCLFLRWFNF